MWAPVERARGTRTNLPWPASEGHEPRKDPPREYLLVIPIDSAPGAALAAKLGPGNGTFLPDAVLDRLVAGTLPSAH